jgi:uncharacterized protein YukE
METIYYLSEIRWKRETLFAHARYVEKSKDFRLMFGNKDEVLKAARIAMEKRKNANAGFSCVFAIPNDLEGEKLREFAEKTKSILSDILNTDYIWIGYHDSISIAGNQNKHFHIIVANMDRNGKALRVNRQVIKSFRAGLQNLIESYGYSIRRDEHSIGHLGYILLKDEEARQSYIEYLNAKRQVEKEMEEEVVKYERKLEEIGREIQEFKARTRSTGTNDRGEEGEAPRIRYEFESFRKRIQDDFNSNRWSETRIQPTISKDRETQEPFYSILQLHNEKSGEIRRWIAEDIRGHQWKQKQIEDTEKALRKVRIIFGRLQNALKQEQEEIQTTNRILQQNIREIQEIRQLQEQKQEPDQNQRPRMRF